MTELLPAAQFEVPFNVVDEWEEIQGSCARFYAAAKWGYAKAVNDCMNTVTIPVSTLETMIENLNTALQVCYNVDYVSDDNEKSAPYATGYSRAAMQLVKDQLMTCASSTSGTLTPQTQHHTPYNKEVNHLTSNK